MKRNAALFFLLAALIFLPTATFATGGDSCAAATPIVIPACDGTPTTDTPIGMTTATDSGFTPGSCFSPAGSMDGDRWYSWTNGTGVSQDLTASTDLASNPGAGDSEIAIFDDCIPTTELDCDQDGGVMGSSFLSIATATVPAGATAMIAVDGWNGDTNFDTIEFDCSPTPPVATNETCALCTVIPSLPYTDTVNNDTSAAGPPPGSCNIGAATEMQNDIWYCITPTVNCDIDVTVDPDAGAGYDGIAVVHSGASCAGLTEDQCIDDPEPQVFTTISATAGTTYYIQIGDFGTGEGGGVTTINVSSPDGCAVPVQLQTFSVD